MTDQRTRQEKKQIRRNLKGLLTKAFRYGQLNGVEVGLYIFYTNKNKLVWYESEGYVLQDQIQNKKKASSTVHYGPEDMRDLVKEAMSNSEKVKQRKIEKLDMSSFPKLPDSCISFYAT